MSILLIPAKLTQTIRMFSFLHQVNVNTLFTHAQKLLFDSIIVLWFVYCLRRIYSFDICLVGRLQITNPL